MSGKPEERAETAQPTQATVEPDVQAVTQAAESVTVVEPAVKPIPEASVPPAQVEPIDKVVSIRSTEPQKTIPESVAQPASPDGVNTNTDPATNKTKSTKEQEEEQELNQQSSKPFEISMQMKLMLAFLGLAFGGPVWGAAAFGAAAIGESVIKQKTQESSKGNGSKTPQPRAKGVDGKSIDGPEQGIDTPQQTLQPKLETQKQTKIEPVVQQRAEAQVAAQQSQPQPTKADVKQAPATAQSQPGTKPDASMKTEQQQATQAPAQEKKGGVAEYVAQGAISGVADVAGFISQASLMVAAPFVLAPPVALAIAGAGQVAAVGVMAAGSAVVGVGYGCAKAAQMAYKGVEAAVNSVKEWNSGRNAKAQEQQNAVGPEPSVEQTKGKGQEQTISQAQEQQQAQSVPAPDSPPAPAVQAPASPVAPEASVAAAQASSVPDASRAASVVPAQNGEDRAKAAKKIADMIRARLEKQRAACMSDKPSPSSAVTQSQGQGASHQGPS